MGFDAEGFNSNTTLVKVKSNEHKVVEIKNNQFKYNTC